MRRLLYTVAAVVALAPLAAIAPASAAVAHPAAAQTVCSGHEEATIENHPSPGATNNSFWYVSPHGIINDAHASITDWCVLPEGKINNNYAFALRQEGTSNCAELRSDGTTIGVNGCSGLPGNASQELQITQPGPQTGLMFFAADTVDGIAGNGGDQPLELCLGTACASFWTINCIANACGL